MRSVYGLSMSHLRLVVKSVQEALWWDPNEKEWNCDKDWGAHTLVEIAEAMACSDLKPKEKR